MGMLDVVTGLCRGATRRRRLTAKMGNKDYYKGNNVGSHGHFMSNGKFVIDQHKLRKWAVPDLTDFKLHPYVAPDAENILNERTHTFPHYFSNDHADVSDLDPAILDRCSSEAELAYARLKASLKLDDEYVAQQRDIRRIETEWGNSKGWRGTGQQ
ncbi:hypothetical protein HDV00_010346 [Rhizophlyctis rosea]|nr:hypothetical protein HDV00_010346 [Rhizophlyctis rosea]